MGFGRSTFMYCQLQIGENVNGIPLYLAIDRSKQYSETQSMDTKLGHAPVKPIVDAMSS